MVEETTKDTRKVKSNRKEHLRGKDIGLMIYTTKSTGRLKETLTQEKFIKGLREEKHKKTYKDEILHGNDQQKRNRVGRMLFEN